MKTIDGVEYLTTKELSQRWNKSEQHLINMRNKKKGCPYVKIFGKVFYELSVVEEFEKPEVVEF